MASTYDESLLEFDLNFLHQPSINPVLENKDQEKLRNNLQFVKKKIVNIDSLVKKYFATKEILDETERVLQSSKEECKKVCIDYKESFDKCITLEKDIKLLLIRNKELEKHCGIIEDNRDAMQSHTKQLETLVKQQETAIESFKVEKNLEKNNAKEWEQKITSVQQENKQLLKHILLIRNVALGTMKLKSKHRKILEKYEKLCKDGNDSSCSENSDNDDDGIFEDDMSPATRDCSDNENPIKGLKLSQELSKIKDIRHVKVDDVTRDSDSSNELASTDTGRGSSRAFSNSDRCFPSPDYYMNDMNDSPQTGLKNMVNENCKLIDSATSPLTISETHDVGTSPVTFIEGETISTPTNYNVFTNIASTSPSVFFSNANRIPVNKLNDQSTSPITDFNDDISRSPKNNVSGSVKVDNPVHKNMLGDISENICSMKIDNPVHKDSIILKQKSQECLEMNNRLNLCDDDSNDCEIETILNKMRLDCKLITPLPCSPVKSNRTTSISSISNQSVHVCAESVVLREENKKMSADIAGLRDQVENIKHLLKSHNMDTTLKKKRKDKKGRKTKDLTTKLPEKVLPHEESLSDRDDPEDLVILSDLIPSPERSTSRIEDDEFMDNDPIILPGITPLCSLNKITTEAVNKDIRSEPTEKVPKLNSVQRLLFEDSEVANQEFSLEVSNSSFEQFSQKVTVEDQSDKVTDCVKKTAKVKRLTRLEKLRQKLVPKCKIKSDSAPPVNKLRLRPKVVSNKIVNSDSLGKSKPTAVESSAMLNDKAVYEKALKVVAELNLKQIITERKVRKSVRRNASINNSSLERIYPNNKSEASDNQGNVKKTNTSIMQTKIMSPKEDKTAPNGKISKCDITTALHNRKKCENKNHLLTNNKECPIEQAVTEVVSNDNTISQLCLDKNKETKSKKSCASPIDLDNDLKAKEKSKKLKKFTDKECVAMSVAEKSKRNSSTGLSAEELSDVLNVNGKSGDKTPEKTTNKEMPSPLLDTKNKRLKRLGTDDISEELPTKRCLRSTSRVSGVDNLINNNSSEGVHYKSPRSGLRSGKNNSASYCENVSSNLDEKDSEIIKHKLQTSEDNNNKGNKYSHVDSMDCYKLDQPISYSDISIFADDDNTINEDPRDNGTKNTELYNAQCSDNGLLDNGKAGNKKSKKNNNCEANNLTSSLNPQESVFCIMLEKYGRKEKKHPKPISDKIANKYCELIEKYISSIIQLPAGKTLPIMNNFVKEIENWPYKGFFSGLVKYLMNADRKLELYNKTISPPAPPMTKSEQVLLYVIPQLQKSWTRLDVVNTILNNIEYALFKLNKTPEFDTIESLSHFYAVLCRYIKAKGRLRVFILDAMYCIQFKSIPLIKQCLDVWHNIIPLAHMGMAKTPLVACLVYLLHFYKCEDKFNRVQEMRTILNRRYSYQFSEWNETRILELFRNAITDLRDIPLEKKMLRLALILLAKRNGLQWCQNNIIKLMLIPMIEKGTVSEIARNFCIAMLGPLLKPYPMDMKLHCEIAMNQLVDLLKQSSSKKTQEAIISSLIFMSKHNQNKVVHTLLMWKQHKISTDLEELLKDFIQAKSVYQWQNHIIKSNRVDI